MSAPAPATAGQLKQIMDLFDNSLTSEQYQQFLGGGDLVKAMLARGDLTKVDRKSFQAVLAGELTLPLPEILWTPVGEYAQRINARRELRGWSLADAQLTALAIELQLYPHAGRLLPTGVTMWLGQDLDYNRAEAIAWLKDEVEALGFEFTDYTGSDRTTFYPGSELEGDPFVFPIGLDLEAHRDRENGIVPNQVRPNCPTWPSLEVPWLYCLNPQVYVAMNGTDNPYALAPGLVVGSADLPRFCRHGRKAYVGSLSGSSQWPGTAMVAFRELEI